MTTLRERLTFLMRTIRENANGFRATAALPGDTGKKRKADLERRAMDFDKFADMLERELKK